MMKCSKECIPICDTCVFCIRNEDTTPVGCSLYPDKFSETGYCDDFYCSLALARWEINEDGYYPYCTKCGKEPQDGKMTEICPNCKARMVNSNATD